MNFDELANVSIRAVTSLLALFFVTKLIGKKQVSELSLFDYVIGISIGNFAAEMTINLESNELNGILAVLIFGVCGYLVAYLTMKSVVLRRFFMGTPTVIIQNGKILENNMRKLKFDMNDMLEQTRSNGYFDLSQIEYALMEANGKLSILPKSDYRPLTPKDMNLKLPKEGLCANIVIDGKIMHNNLKTMNKDEKWLERELKIKGNRDLSKILLVTLDNNEKVTIYEKNANLDALNVLE